MKRKRLLLAGIGLLLLFALWTVLIQCVDVQAIGPGDTKVGFAALNAWFHRLTGVNLTLYTVTDWLGLVPVFICGCFGILGLRQWILRKKLFQVDSDILLLGVYYLTVILGYLFFEMVPISCRFYRYKAAVCRNHLLRNPGDKNLAADQGEKCDLTDLPRIRPPRRRGSCPEQIPAGKRQEIIGTDHLVKFEE